MNKQKPNYDGPNTLQNDEATVLWILSMMGAPMIKQSFVSLICIWILFTVCWYKHITRHDGGK